MLSLDEPDHARASARSKRRPPDADALFVFSSGTTGMPKAVRHTHGAFAVGRAALARRAAA